MNESRNFGGVREYSESGLPRTGSCFAGDPDLETEECMHILQRIFRNRTKQHLRTVS